jgi:hypothetical protein
MCADVATTATETECGLRSQCERAAKETKQDERRWFLKFYALVSSFSKARSMQTLQKFFICLLCFFFLIKNNKKNNKFGMNETR